MTKEEIQKFKLELLQYLSQKIIVDIIAFGFPFLTTLFISNLMYNWLSPKFSVPGLLIWGETDQTFVSSFIDDLPDFVTNLQVFRIYSH